MTERMSGHAGHGWTWQRLAAYAGGRLDDAETMQVERHLRVCAECRRDLSIQVVNNSRLVDASLAEPGLAEAQAASLHALQRYANRRRGIERVGLWSRIPLRRLAVYGGWCTAILLAILLVHREAVHGADTEVVLSPSIPMIDHALSDYRLRIRHGIRMRPVTLERLSRDVGLPVSRLLASRARLIAGWAMTLRGEPAAALAYRLDGQVVIQYVISEALFFRQQVVRDAVRRTGRYRTVDGDHAVVAWPGLGAGVLLIGAGPVELLDRVRVPG